MNSLLQKWWNINLEVLSRRSFLPFGSLKYLNKSFQIYFYSNHYFLSDELFCKIDFYIWIDQWDQIFHEIYPPVDRESFWFIQYIAHAAFRRGKTQRVPWKEDKIRKGPDGTGTIRIWLYRNLRLYWTKERWSWKEIGTLLKRTNPSTKLIYFMTHNSWVTWWNIPNLSSYWRLGRNFIFDKNSENLRKCLWFVYC